MDAEFARLIKFCVAGVPVNDETLSLDVINDVGPFQRLPQPRRHLPPHAHPEPAHAHRPPRPRGVERRRFDDASTSAPRARAREILETHVPTPLPEGAAAEMAAIVADAERELGVEARREPGQADRSGVAAQAQAAAGERASENTRPMPAVSSDPRPGPRVRPALLVGAVADQAAAGGRAPRAPLLGLRGQALPRLLVAAGQRQHRAPAPQAGRGDRGAGAHALHDRPVGGQRQALRARPAAGRGHAGRPESRPSSPTAAPRPTRTPSSWRAGTRAGRRSSPATARTTGRRPAPSR